MLDRAAPTRNDSISNTRRRQLHHGLLMRMMGLPTAGEESRATPGFLAYTAGKVEWQRQRSLKEQVYGQCSGLEAKVPTTTVRRWPDSLSTSGSGSDWQRS